MLFFGFLMTKVLSFLKEKILMSLRFFSVTKNDKEIFKKILRTRYEVYCLERGFESPEDCPGGLETDIYDDQYAIHLAAVRTVTGEVVGTARIILDSPFRFPVEKHFGVKFDSSIKREKIGEISRLAVPKRYRHEFEITAGLFQRIGVESRRLGLEYWVAAMAKGLPVLLRKKNIFFDSIGDEIDFHGMRAPYFGRIQDIECKAQDKIYDIQKQKRWHSKDDVALLGRCEGQFLTKNANLACL